MIATPFLLMMFIFKTEEAFTFIFRMATFVGVMSEASSE